ncbi:hypothetical protein HAX54_049354, partial [Datura stramonium]|nr:hypothetical protein [Datura stramonium]
LRNKVAPLLSSTTFGMMESASSEQVVSELRSWVRFPRVTCCMRQVLGGGLLGNTNILPVARPMKGQVAEVGVISNMALVWWA